MIGDDITFSVDYDSGTQRVVLESADTAAPSPCRRAKFKEVVVGTTISDDLLGVDIDDARRDFFNCSDYRCSSSLT